MTSNFRSFLCKVVPLFSSFLFYFIIIIIFKNFASGKWQVLTYN